MASGDDSENGGCSRIPGSSMCSFENVEWSGHVVEIMASSTDY